MANLLIKYNAFKMKSKFLIGSYEQFWIINGSVCPAITGNMSIDVDPEEN